MTGRSESGRPLTPLTFAGAVLVSLILGPACTPSEGAPVDDGASPPFQQGLASDTLVDPRPTFLGIYRPAGGSTPTVVSRTEAEFLSDMTAQRNADFEMRSLTSHTVNGQLRYSAVWWPHPAAGLPSQFVIIGRTLSEFNSQYFDLTGQGWRMTHVSTAVIGSNIHYSAIFNQGSGDHTLGLARTQAQFDADWRWWWSQGRRLACLSSSVVNGQVFYTGVYVPNTAEMVVVNGVTSAGFIAEFNNQWQRGLRLTLVATYVLDDIVRYTGLFTTGGDAWISFGQPEAEFLQTQEVERTRGSRLWQIHTSHVEGLALNRLASGIRDIFWEVSVGSATTVAHGNLRFRAISGQRRTTTDPPAREASTSARVNSASVSKNATAIAVLKALKDRGFTVGGSVAPFLPSDWPKGDNINGLTFHQLLTHTSGLRSGNPADKLDYISLRNMIAAGRPPGNFQPDYMNANFSLFRIILPYLRGFNDSGVFDKDSVTAARYLFYMNDTVFAPAGIATVEAKPAAFEPTLFYPFPASTTGGVDFGDWTKEAGAAGLELSSDDIVQMLVKRADGTLLHSESRDMMDRNGYGWDASNAPIRHGTFRSKGGMLPGNAPDGRSCAVNTVAVSVSNGVQVGAVINSTLSVDTLETVKTVYGRSWVPMY